MTTTNAFHDIAPAPGTHAGRADRPRPVGTPIVGADRAALHDLVSRLGRWLDDKWYDDPVETAAILSPDATVATPGGEARGLVDIAAQARRGHQAYRTHHQITNVLAIADAADPDHAEIRANLQVVFADLPQPSAPIGEPLFTLGEVYAFRAHRTADGWRLSRVEIQPVWKIGDRPAVAA